MISDLSKLLDIFLLDCQARRLTKSTQHFYSSKVGAFTKWLAGQGVGSVVSVTANHIRSYLKGLGDQGYKDTSQHDYARAIKTFFNFCVREEVIEKSPFAKVRMPKLEDRLPVILTDKEIATALKKISSRRNKVIVRFILDSGVRASELLALNVGDVDFETGVVTILQGKQQKDRLTYIGATTRKDLKKYILECDSTEALFVSERNFNKRLTMQGLMSVFRLIQEETGVGVTAHTLRRTMATKAIENGMNIYVLAKMLGHVDTQMLRKYAVVSRKTIQEQSKQFSVVDHLG